MTRTTRRAVLFISALVVSGCAARGAGTPAPTAPMGMGRVQISPVTTDPEVESRMRASPDGTKLLFNLRSRGRSRFSLNPSTGDYDQTAIAVVEIGSAGKTIVSQEGAKDPSWFPDSHRFVFSAVQGREALLATSSLAQTSSATRFVSPTPCVAYDQQPSISPDAKRIAFTSVEGGRGANIAIMDVESTAEKCKILFPGQDPQWHPRTQQFLFTRTVSGNAQIFIFDEPRNALTQISFGDYHNFDPAWSPDGTRIAYVSYRNGNGDIYVVNADGSGLIQITEGPTQDSSPAWSADGQIYFISDANGQVDIWRASLDGN